MNGKANVAAVAAGGREREEGIVLQPNPARSRFMRDDPGVSCRPIHRPLPIFFYPYSTELLLRARPFIVKKKKDKLVTICLPSSPDISGQLSLFKKAKKSAIFLSKYSVFC